MNTLASQRMPLFELDANYSDIIKKSPSNVSQTTSATSPLDYSRSSSAAVSPSSSLSSLESSPTLADQPSVIPAFYRSMRAATIDGPANKSQLSETTVAVLTTGGTMGSNPYPAAPKNSSHLYPVCPPARAEPLTHSPISRALQLIEPDCHYDIMEVCACDSQDMLTPTSEEFTSLKTAIQNTVKLGTKSIVVTIGTDGMIPVSRRLNKELSADLKQQKATVVFTGAMMPLSNGVQSDGYRNLANAMKRVQHATPGVHISMENLFPLDDATPVTKDRSRESKQFLIGLN